MKLSEAVILEGLSSVLYHAISLRSAKEIILGDRIPLEPTGDGHYILPLSRNRTMDFSSYNIDPNNDAFVILSLDGRRMASRYHGIPSIRDDVIISEKSFISRARSYINKINFIMNGNDINPYIIDSLSRSFDVAEYETYRQFMRSL